MYSIEDIPNEIIYRIFDNLDTNSIISFSLTCKKNFYYLNNYNNYKINFKSISKCEFDSICHLINPLNIRSLILSDDDKTPGQIKLFMKNNLLKNYLNLKCLKLLKINENDLENLLKDIYLNELNILKIEYRQYFQLLNSSTILILNKIFSLNSLKEIHLDMRTYENNSIQWKFSLNIENLFLFNLNLNQFIEIIEKENQFKLINLKNLILKESDQINSKLIYLNNLKRFQIEESEFLLDKIEILLKLMPKLYDLKLEGYLDSQLKNIFPKTFQFFFRFPLRNYNLNLFSNLKTNLIKTNDEIYFYTIPLIKNSFNYSSELNKYSSFISHLNLNIKNIKISQELFFNLNSLKLIIDDQCLLNSFEILSKSIYLNNLTKIILIISSRGSYLNIIILNFINLIEKLIKLKSLEIFNRWHGIFSYINIENFCLKLPLNLKHLDIDISDINQIKILIEKLNYLKSFKFRYSFDKSIFIQNILQWLTNKQINYTYILDIHYLSIWISQQQNYQNNSSNKRIKLSY